ncbi:hypothetical protein M501DRAFT_54397 [Patellaria atrata CBS 101060]|uniref:Uncharacterized protein n=1 Tax=Patellaria atrata CBS 101060 TaxID=1346257 RepID=A0A9P4SJP4_9PEZI|nr:hypothetical protein M501DRAFT_54397 [Patellaria atrata CBS 101060]
MLRSIVSHLSRVYGPIHLSQPDRNATVKYIPLHKGPVITSPVNFSNSYPSPPSHQVSFLKSLASSVCSFSEFRKFLYIGLYSTTCQLDFCIFAILDRPSPHFQLRYRSLSCQYSPVCSRRDSSRRYTTLVR